MPLNAGSAWCNALNATVHLLRTGKRVLPTAAERFHCLLVKLCLMHFQRLLPYAFNKFKDYFDGSYIFGGFFGNLPGAYVR